MESEKLLKIINKAENNKKDAIERGNDLMAEYYQGQIDLANEIINNCIQCKKDIVNEMYTKVIKDVSEKDFDQYIKLFVLDAISESHDKILKDISK